MEDPENDIEIYIYIEISVAVCVTLQNDKILTGTGGAVRNKQQAPRPAPPISCNVRILIRRLLKKRNHYF